MDNSVHVALPHCLKLFIIFKLPWKKKQLFYYRNCDLIRVWKQGCPASARVWNIQITQALKLLVHEVSRDYILAQTVSVEHLTSFCSFLQSLDHGRYRSPPAYCRVLPGKRCFFCETRLVQVSVFLLELQRYCEIIFYCYNFFFCSFPV